MCIYKKIELKFQADQFLIKGYYQSTSGIRLISQFLGVRFLLYASTANIQEAMKFYNIGDKSFETDFSYLKNSSH